MAPHPIRWLPLLYCTSHYTTTSRYTTVPPIKWLYLPLHDCTPIIWLYLPLNDCTSQYTTVPPITWLYLPIHDCTSHYMTVPSITWFYLPGNRTFNIYLLFPHKYRSHNINIPVAHFINNINNIQKGNVWINFHLESLKMVLWLAVGL